MSREVFKQTRLLWKEQIKHCTEYLQDSILVLAFEQNVVNRKIIAGSTQLRLPILRRARNSDPTTAGSARHSVNLIKWSIMAEIRN